MLKKLILILCIPLYLLSQEVQDKPVELIKTSKQTKEVSKDEVNTSNLKKIEIESNLEDISNLTEEEQQLKVQNKLLNDVIENINNESFLKTLNNNEKYSNELTLLTNRININTKAQNVLAVKRDQLDVYLIKEKQTYEDTLKNIIIAKQEYKDKKYIQELVK